LLISSDRILEVFCGCIKKITNPKPTLKILI
jgi:hypothetical protein